MVWGVAATARALAIGAWSTEFYPLLLYLEQLHQVELRGLKLPENQGFRAISFKPKYQTTGSTVYSHSLPRAASKSFLWL